MGSAALPRHSRKPQIGGFLLHKHFGSLGSCYVNNRWLGGRTPQDLAACRRPSAALQWRHARGPPPAEDYLRRDARRLLVYCGDYKCAHSVEISADRWGDGVRLSDIEPLFTCQACGKRGADVRPNFDWEQEARRAVSTDDTRRVWPSPSGPRGMAEIGRKDDSRQKSC